MKRQALLLIHGIGEQRPMDTLRGFVETVWTTDKDQHRDHQHAGQVWSKPYPLAEDFELRLLTTAENKDGWRTDFFEFYWAHLMQGTKLAHVYSWAKSLLVRWPWTVPRHLGVAYTALLLLVIGGLWLAGTGALKAFQEGGSQPALMQFVVGSLVLPFGAWIITQVVGDAARYLHVAASNVQQRHEIRAAGIKVLKALHDAKDSEGKPKYERIIVVGHSLGSVIGYDILTHAWAARSTTIPAGTQPAFEQLGNLETLANEILDGSKTGLSVDVVELQKAQRRCFNELRANQIPWRVSDFVTLGSPLAHAAILMARDARALRARIVDREFPACLPELESTTVKNQAIRGFSYPAGAAVRTPHHAAVFGPTRWTNLYFPCFFLLWGDLVGGKLAGVFGAGVRDVPVRTWHRLGFLSHTLYWKPAGKWPEKNMRVQALREALDLRDTRGEAPPKVVASERDSAAA